MGAKRIPVEERKLAPLLTTVPLQLRGAVEAIASRERLSIAEVVRRALVQYVGMQRPGTRGRGIR